MLQEVPERHGTVEHQLGGSAARVVRVDEAEVDLPLVAKARTLHAIGGAIDHPHPMPLAREREGDAHPLDAGAQHEHISRIHRHTGD